MLFALSLLLFTLMPIGVARQESADDRSADYCDLDEFGMILKPKDKLMEDAFGHELSQETTIYPLDQLVAWTSSKCECPKDEQEDVFTRLKLLHALLSPWRILLPRLAFLYINFEKCKAAVNGSGAYNFFYLFGTASTLNRELCVCK